MINEINNFKIRCSAIGQIMTNDRSGKAMGQTAKTYCEMWLKSKIYNREKQIQTKYFEKGIEVEADSIEFAAAQLGWGMVFKNEECFKNSFLTGTPDVVMPDVVVDMKNSWDCFSFPLFDSVVEKNYWWQIQGYMELTGRRRAQLVYTLMNTPPEIADREINFKTNEETTQEEFERLIDYYLYDNVSPEFRIKTFSFDYDLEAIELIKKRVEECKIYLLTLI